VVCPVSRWISRVLRYSGISPTAQPACTGLSPSLVGFPTPFHFSLPVFCKTLQPRTDVRFRLLRVRSPLLTESSLFLGLLRCFSSPGSLSSKGVRRHHSSWVSPFGYFRLMRLHTAHRNFSQCTTSFLGTARPGIPRMLLFTFVPCDTEKSSLSRFVSHSLLLRLFACIRLLSCIREYSPGGYP
jgi:hypothetical protein